MMATRTRKLTDKQRHILETLATGGVIVENSGCRGFMRSTTLYTSRDMHGIGEDVHPALLRSLYDPHAALMTVGRTDPGLIETFKPRGAMTFHHTYFRISAKGRAALKQC